MEIGTPQVKPEPSGRLRVAWTVAEGYWWAAWYVRDYAAMAAVWAIVAAGAQLLLGRLLGGVLEEGSPLAADDLSPLASVAVSLFGAAAVAVAAYRLAILGEQPSWRRTQRIGRRELRVFGLSLLVYVAVVAEMLLLMLVLQGGETVDAATAPDAELLPAIIVAVLVSLLIAVTLTPFIGLAFPLAALDAPAGLFRRSLEMSRGHRLRLAAIAFMADLPWLVASYIPWLAWQSFGGEMPEILEVAVSTFITVLGTAFGSMVLGKAFAAIADRRHEGVYGVFD